MVGNSVPEGRAGAGGGMRRMLRPAIILAALLIVAGAGFSGWYFYLGGSAQLAKLTKGRAEPPLFVEVKPFVTTLQGADGSSHFVQLGMNLKVSDRRDADAAKSMLPELQDTIRQTILRFKVEELETADGVERMRRAMVADVNKALAGGLGEDKANPAVAVGGVVGLVKNIYFSSLIIQ